MRLIPLSIVALVAFGAIAVSCAKTLDPSLTDLAVGDCVSGLEGTQEEVEQLDAVDCDEPGAFHVVSVFEVTGYTSYPGQIELDRCRIRAANEVWGRCLEISQRTGDRRGTALVLSSLSLLAARQGRLERARPSCPSMAIR